MKPMVGEYRKLGKVTIGKDCIIDDGVVIGYPPRDVLLRHGWSHSLATRIGPRCVLRSGCIIYATVALGMEVEMGHNAIIREHVRVGKKTKLGSYVEAQPHSAFGEECRFMGPARIAPRTRIGNGVFAAPYLVTLNRKFSRAFMEGRADDEPMTPSTVEDRVLIGAHVVINPGVRIGRESIIAGGSVVTKNIPPGSVVAGLPARIVGTVDERFSEDKNRRS